MCSYFVYKPAWQQKKLVETGYCDVSVDPFSKVLSEQTDKEDLFPNEDCTLD